MWTTTFTTLLGVRAPIVLAPMGGAAGGALAAAVSNGGGLGLLGAGRADDPAWLESQLEVLTSSTSQPWGVGFQSWAAPPETVERALAARPAAVMFSFGDPGRFVPAVRSASARLILQVTDLDEARRAVELGADIIVAQGTDAGGHGGTRGTIGLVPTVVDLARPTPVLAAGGIADGRGLAAALALGAAGAVIGTRFLATPEALIPPAYTKALLEHGGDDTERSRVLDIVRDSGWPDRYTARTVRTRFLDRWRDAEDRLRGDPEARRAFQRMAERGDPAAAVHWAGDALDLVEESAPAADIVAGLLEQARVALHRAHLGDEP